MYICDPHRPDLPTTQQQQQQQQPITTAARQQRAAHSQTDGGLAVAEALAFLDMTIGRDAAQCRDAL